MTDINEETVEFVDDFVGDFLEHHGVKGMKWGVRRDKASTASQGPAKIAVKTQPGKRVQTSGGQRHHASKDAKTAATYKQKAKASTTDSLSNHELQALVKRMQLEQQYNQLRPKSKQEKAKHFLAGLLLNTGKQQAGRVANDYAAQRVGTILKSK